MNPSRFRTFLEWLLDNLFDLATILVAGYLVIRHQVQPFGPNNTADLLSGILAVLGLIAVSGLWDRNRRLGRIEKLAQDSSDLIRQRIAGRAKADEFFLAKNQMISAASVATANSIDLAGITLTRTMRDYMDILSLRLQAKAAIRIIIVDPQKEEVLKELVRRSNFGDNDAIFWLDSLRTSQAVISAVAKTLNATGKLQIGYLPYAPAFGLTIVDGEQPHAIAQVEIYHHRSSEHKATFMLKKADDPSWFDFFNKQFTVLWKSCRVEQLYPPTTP